MFKGKAELPNGSPHDMLLLQPMLAGRIHDPIVYIVIVT